MFLDIKNGQLQIQPNVVSRKDVSLYNLKEDQHPHSSLHKSNSLAGQIEPSCLFLLSDIEQRPFPTSILYFIAMTGLHAILY